MFFYQLVHIEAEANSNFHYLSFEIKKQGETHCLRQRTGLLICQEVGNIQIKYIVL